MTNGLPAGSHVMVVGGGVVGTSAAYALRQAGYSVTLTSAGTVGEGATSANAGLLVPADSVVWASPANRRQVPATILRRGGSTIEVAWSNPRTVPWGLRFLMSSSRERYDAACRAAHALSVHSLAVATSWARRPGIAADLASGGMVFLLDSKDAVLQFRQARQALCDDGETYVELDHAALTDRDPAYADLSPDHHAVYAANAASGDSGAFTRALLGELAGAGVMVLENCPVHRILVTAGRAVGVATAGGEIAADAVVLAAGIATRRLASTAGVGARILPVKGYAATVPIKDGNAAPRLGGVLESHHVAYSRMGGYLRLSTGAEVGRADLEVTGSARASLQEAGEALFPGALDWTAATYQAGHRPMTAGGLPLIGPTRVAGLYLDSGHGSLGWTQAAGSADLLRHLIAGDPPPIDPTPYLPGARAKNVGAPLRATN